MSPSAQPRSIIAGPDGDLWFTEENLRRLGRITTAGVVTEYPLTLANAGRPAEIARGPNRTLWITTAAGNQVARVLLHPSVTTGAAGAITQTTARIAGAVDPFASSTGYVVQYGRTTAYGAVTEAEIVLPAPGPVSVAVPLAGLAPGTRYHYRLVGSSFAGSTEGADATFTTAGTPGSGRGTGPSSRDRTGPRMRIGGAALLARRGRVSLSLGCPLAETLGCRGRVRLVRVPPRAAIGAARAPLRLGTARFRIGGGQHEGGRHPADAAGAGVAAGPRGAAGAGGGARGRRRRQRPRDRQAPGAAAAPRLAPQRVDAPERPRGVAAVGRDDHGAPGQLARAHDRVGRPEGPPGTTVEPERPHRVRAALGDARQQQAALGQRQRPDADARGAAPEHASVGRRERDGAPPAPAPAPQVDPRPGPVDDHVLREDGRGADARR